MPRSRGASTKKHSQLPPLTSLGEFGLIGYFSSLLGKYSTNNIIKSIGDDAAVMRNGKNSVLVFTTDALVENVHFNFRFDDPYSIGWKSIVASLSDIAAMNANPLCAVITIAIPPKTSSDVLVSLYKGVYEAAKIYGCPVVGGDTAASPSGIFISVAAIGTAAKKAITYRSGAKPGDIVCVTNDLGRAYAALKVLQSEKKTGNAFPARLLQKHARPAPQFKALDNLRKARITPNSMIDISDGLSSELWHIAKQSGVRIEIDKDAIPIHPATKQCAKSFSEDPIMWALQSGEEYELLFTVSPRYKKTVSSLKGVAIIGEVKKGNGVWAVSRRSKNEKLPVTGYRHF
ncbi:MAG TPA: thiamine-phosphate kinase [Candidatus Kapabacteria bacterium]|nr:thiamine-phosphate kinase [Candidatus Kapabacteria bacterium]